MTAQTRPILIHPDRRLRTKCEPVAQVDDSIRLLLEEMLATMYEAPGVGLAAPQVGVLQRVVVMDCADKDAPPAPLRMVNPEIVWSSEALNVHEEGCLSIPEEYADVTRPARVRARWLDEAGAPQEAEFDGLWATCIQHEIDHLEGKLFIDHLGPLKRKLITDRMKKLKRARLREQAEGEAGVA